MLKLYKNYDKDFVLKNLICQDDRSFYEEVTQLTTIGVVAIRNDIDCFLL